MPPQPRPLRPNDPREIGGFALLGRLGEGGQGTVYLGGAPDGRRVAVKLLRAELEEGSSARRHLERELAAVRRVAPFCTARILDARLDGEQPYVVSEYIDGPSLQRLVAEQGPLRGDGLLRLAIGTATALAAVHRAGVIHRDFKPGNVLLGPDGPRVIDFGIARPLERSSTTLSGAIGTPAYMAPEQLAAGSAGPPLDMFAWGCTMAFAANGVPPFGNDSIPAVMQRILHGEPELGSLEGPLRDLVAACLEKDPARRPTALQALTALLGGGEHRDPLAEGAHAASAAPPPVSLVKSSPPSRVSLVKSSPPSRVSLVKSSPPPSASPERPPPRDAAPPPSADPPQDAPPPAVPPRAARPPIAAAAGRRPTGSPAPRPRARLIALAAAGAITVLGGTAVTVALLRGGPAGSGGAGTAAAQSPSPSGTAASSPAATPGDGTPSAGGPCRYLAADGGSVTRVGAPPARPVADGPVRALLTTDRGALVLDLDGANAPCAVNSIVHLAAKGFYDGTRCHRLTTAPDLRILQCGDPSGDGTGGPDYRFAAENTRDARYTRGVVAMARSAEPDSTGSQFFIVYGDSQIPPDYTVVGRVATGMEVIDQVARGGVDPVLSPEDGSPRIPITIQSLRTEPL